MTRTELNTFLTDAAFKGYKIKKGFCCFNEDNLEASEMLCIGQNYGICGWNWSCFFSPKTNTVYVSGFRNY